MAAAADGVEYKCDAALGTPPKEDCERALFEFSDSSKVDVVLDPQTPPHPKPGTVRKKDKKKD